MNLHLSTLIAASLFAGAALAGPLDPPPGPVGPSGPRLLDVYDNDSLADTVDDIDQVANEHLLFETRTDVLSLAGDDDSAHVIDVMGSYYLSDDVVVNDPGKGGIKIMANNVTLDLNGYRVIHTNPPAPGPDPYYGVFTWPAGELRTNVVVRNGTVSDFTSGQVRMWAQVSRVENIVATGGQTNVISIPSGDSNLIIGCRIDRAIDTGYAFVGGTNAYGYVAAECSARTAELGFYFRNGAAVRDCVASGLTLGTGFVIESGSVVRRCAARGNNGHGFFSNLDQTILIADCVASANAFSGFLLERTLAVNCLADSSGTDGFRLRFRNYLYNCTAIDSDDSGFEITFEGNRVEGCHAESVGAIPANEGFLATSDADGCMVVRNTAVNAFGHFVNAAPGTTLFAPHWFDITLAGPWDNVAQ